jgi:transposase-like protein
MAGKKKPRKNAKPRGRPPIRYDSELHPAFAKALAIDGLTNEEIAKKLGCSEDTLRKWTKLYPEFFGALKEGKESADSRVELALYTKALGFEVTEKRAVVVGTGPSAKVEFVTETRYVPPDNTACIFWLKNRRPDKWRDRSQQEISGPDGEPLHVKIIKGVSMGDL